MNAPVYQGLVVNNKVQEQNTLVYKDQKQTTDAVLQTYFREANRTVDFKLYKARIRHEKKDVVIYFINRIEIGSLQTGKRLEKIHNYLESPDPTNKAAQLKEIVEDSESIVDTEHEKDEFNVSIKCRLRDRTGKTNDGKTGPNLQTLDVQNCSYLKFLNLPSILDINGSDPDPTEEAIDMALIDKQTLDLVSKFINDNRLGQDLSERDQTVKAEAFS